jgi:hypothetical protein
VKEVDNEQLNILLNWWKEVTTEHSAYKAKEVDLDKELNKYFITNNLIAADIQFEPVTQMKKCAKYFFELGLKAQHSSIGIPNIDDIFEEEGIEPNSKDAKIFKECYYMALEKLKAQKGE